MKQFELTVFIDGAEDTDVIQAEDEQAAAAIAKRAYPGQSVTVKEVR